MVHENSLKNLVKWEKGQSGNPEGYPKGQKNRSTIVREWLETKEWAHNHISGDFETLTQEEIITLAMIEKARNGNVQAYKCIMDSAYGKPEKQIEQVFLEVPLFPDVQVLDGQGNVIEDE